MTKARYRKILVIPDTHAPYHSKRAWKAMIDYARILKPDIIVHIGDFVDSRNASRHANAIKYTEDYRSEIGRVKPLVNDIQSLGAKSVHWVKGNHDAWPEKRMQEVLPTMESCVLRVEDILGVKDLGWKITQYGKSLKLGKVYYTHDTGSAGAKGHTDARIVHGFENVVIGHTHRMNIDIQGSATGRTVVAMMMGWLGDPNHIDYRHSIAARQWPHGFAVGFMQPNGATYFSLVPIVKGRAYGPTEFVRY